MFKFLSRKLFVFSVASVLLYLGKVEWYCWAVFGLVFIDDIIINRTLASIVGRIKWK